MRTAGDISFRLSSTVGVVEFCGSNSLFSEAAQKVFQVDELGDLLIPKLEAGAAFSELVEAVAARGLPKTLAPVCAENFLSSLANAGLIEIDLPPPRRPTFGTYDLAGISIRFDGIPAHVAKLVSPLLALSARTRRRPDVVYGISNLHDRICISRNPHRDMIVGVDELVPALKASLSQDILDDTSDRIALHGALLVRNGRGLVLCGRPGAGKSTLATFLTAEGYRYESDDICMIDRNGKALGVPFPASLKGESWKLLRKFGGRIRELPVHRRLDGDLVRYFAPLERPTTRKVAIHRIVYLVRTRKGKPALQPLAFDDAVARLIEGAYSSSHGLTKSQVQLFLDMLARVRFDELRYSKLAAVPPLLNV